MNAIRVVLATAVIVSHSWPIGGFGPDPEFGDSGVGHWAVAGFFAISGYLVTGSRVRLGFGSYLLRRAARILPGFWACLVVTAGVVAPLTAATFVGLTGLNVAVAVSGNPSALAQDVLWLATAFTSGVVLYLYRDRVVLHPLVAAAAVAVLVGGGLTSTVDVVGQLPTAYLMLGLATVLPAWCRVFRRNDISYGMYIYGFVVQQCLQMAGVARAGVAVFAVAGIVATVPLAYLSWFLVEKPAKAAVAAAAGRPYVMSPRRRASRTA